MKPPTDVLTRALVWYASAPAVTPTGETVPPPLPGLETYKLPSAATVMTNLGWSEYEHHERWVRLRRERGLKVDFGNDVLYQFFPPELWRATAAMIADGPLLAAARGYEALHRLVERGVPGNRRRPAGPPSLRYLKSLRFGFHQVFDNLLMLRSGRVAPAILDQWDYAPRVELPDVPLGGYSTHAPPVHLVRAKLDEFTRDVRTRLGIDRAGRFDEETAAIAAAGPRECIGLWRPLQRRALLSLYASVGGRKHAMRRLRRADFIPDYRSPDGEVGPVLMLHPGKSAGRWLVRVKHLHPELGAVLGNYLFYVDRVVWFACTCPRSVGRGRPDERPPPRSDTVPPDAALIPRSIADWRALNPTDMFTGVTLWDSDAERWNGDVRALIPRQGQLPAGISEELRPFIGYSPHEYRHLAFQLAVRAGGLHNERHLGAGAEPWAKPEMYGHALLDHGNPQNLARLYGDFGSEAALELLAARANRGAWELLTTSAGVRRRPDVATYECELERLCRVEEELAELARHTRRLADVAAIAEVEPPPSAGDLDAEGLGADAKLDRLLEQNEELLQRLESLRAATLERHAVTHDILQLTQQRAVVMRRLDSLRLDTRTWLPVPDTDPTPPLVDWDEIDRRVLSASSARAAIAGPGRGRLGAEPG